MPALCVPCLVNRVYDQVPQCKFMIFYQKKTLKRKLMTQNISNDIKIIAHNTVLVLIKLTKFAVALRLRCGSCKLIF